nr:MAG TPA: hypothetical protein [Caudoviricetes sp.]
MIVSLLAHRQNAISCVSTFVLCTPCSCRFTSCFHCASPHRATDS